jgi:hypothetical protein
MLGHTPRTSCAREFLAAVDAGTIDPAWFNVMPGFLDTGGQFVGHDEAERDLNARRDEHAAPRHAPAPRPAPMDPRGRVRRLTHRRAARLLSSVGDD